MRRACKVEPRVIPGKVGGWRPNSGRKPIYASKPQRPGYGGGKRNSLELAQGSFWENLSKRVVVPDDYENKCWVFSGYHNKSGRPCVNLAGVCILAHRAVFLLANGSEPEVVMHTCDNPSCVSPFHLRGGTQKENLQDMVRKQRHPRSLKLTKTQVESLVAAYKLYGNYRMAGAVIGVNRYTATRIVRDPGKYYAH